MPRHTLKLLVLLTVFSMAPATAGHRLVTAAANRNHSDCPYARARAEAAAQAAAAQASAPAKTEPTTITLDDRVHSQGSVFTIERGSSFLTP